MKKNLIILVTLLLWGLNSFSQPPCELESFKIEYKFFDGIQNGTKTLIFADSGKIEKQITFSLIDTSKLSFMPKEIPEVRSISNWLIIKTLDSVYQIDLDLMIGQKSERFNLDASSIINKSLKKIGEGLYLDRKCNIYDFNGFKMWYWKGIVVKKEMTFSGGEKFYEVATSIDEKYTIKKDEFIIPAGVKIEN